MTTNGTNISCAFGQVVFMVTYAIHCVIVCSEVSLVFSTTLKTKVGANQPITDILTCESGVETAFYQLPSVSCCF